MSVEVGEIKDSVNNPFTALKHKDFAIYWLSMSISAIGSWMQKIALPWLAYTLTKSAFLLGLVEAMQFLPVLILSLFAGVFIDKFNKKKILYFTQIALLLITAVLTILVWNGNVQFWHIITMATLIGVIYTLDVPARQSFIMELVGRKDLMNAIALNSTVFNTARILGPALAGITMAYVGVKFCFLINSISFAAVVIALVFIKPIKVQEKPKSNLHILGEIKDGLTHIYKNETLFRTILSISIVATFGTNFSVLVPVFTREVLGMGETGFGLLMSCSGIGCLIGSICTATLSKKGPQKFVLNIFPIVIAILFIIIGFTHVFAIAGLFIAAIGLFFVSYTSTANSTVQLNAANEYRGRAMSVYYLVFGGFTPFGSLYAGSITEKFGPKIGFAACGATMIILCAALYLYTNSRKVESSDDKILQT